MSSLWNANKNRYALEIGFIYETAAKTANSSLVNNLNFKLVWNSNEYTKQGGFQHARFTQWFMRLIECTWSCKCAHFFGRDVGHMLAGKSSECARDENWVRLTKLMKRVQQKITNSMSVQISPLFIHLSFVQIKRILRQLWCDHACRCALLLLKDANDIKMRASSSCLCAVEIENIQRCNKLSN